MGKENRRVPKRRLQSEGEKKHTKKSQPTIIIIIEKKVTRKNKKTNKKKKNDGKSKEVEWADFFRVQFFMAFIVW